MKHYQPDKLIAASRYQRYFPTLHAFMRRFSANAG